MASSLRIRLLGTAAAWPFPRVGCECPMCAEAAADPDRRRMRPAALVGVPGSDDLVLIDAGADIHWQLLAAGPDVNRRLRAVLLTHPHSDHYLGLDDLSRALKDVVEGTLPLYLLEDNRPVVERTFGYLLPSREGAREWEKARFEPRVVELEQTFEVAGLTVTAFDTFHTDTFTTCAYRIEAGGKSIVYAPDAGRVESEVAASPDVLLIDATELDESTETHLAIEDALALGVRLGAGRTILTHIGHHQIPSADREARVGDRATIAHDGMEIEI